jgi:hypothetical protein
MDKKEIKKRIEEGWIRAHVTFELIGNPKEHVETTIRGYVGLIEKDPQIELLKVEYGEPEEQSKLWCTYAETELLVRGLEKFTELCFNSMPANIEIIEPADLVFSQKDFSMWMNDLLSKLHEASAQAQSVNASNKMLQQNINAIVFNAILLSLESPRTQAEIGKRIGLPEKSIEPFLKKLTEEKKILKKGNKYSKK